MNDEMKKELNKIDNSYLNKQSEKKQKQQEILENLEVTKRILHSTLIDLKLENTDGKQFDYVNSSKLSSVFDDIERLTKAIDKIIYQK